MPFFSIVLPVYNKQRFIGKTLESVFAQTFGDFEVIIVNDGSTDGSEQIINSYTDDRIRYYSKANEGVSSARNLGISLATADYIAFLDADDIWFPNFLEHMHSVIGSHPQYKVFGGACEIESEKTVYPAAYSVQKTAEVQVVDYLDASAKESILWTSTTIVHKSVFEKIGVFANMMSEDIDLWIRIGLEYPIVFSWTIAARYVHDPESLSKQQHLSVQTVDFSKYSELEKTNPKLKDFLDQNRFTLAIKAKLLGDSSGFKKFASQIDTKKLTAKRRMLLQLPGFVLRMLVGFNQFLADIGVVSTVFK